MQKYSLGRKVKLASAAMMLAGGSLFTSCGLSDIKDNLIAGSLAGVKSFATDFVDSLLINFNEIFDATPDNPLIPTP